MMTDCNNISKLAYCCTDCSKLTYHFKNTSMIPDAKKNQSLKVSLLANSD